jgi:hypothetical protein
VKFLILFLPVCNYHNRKGKILSSPGKKQNEASVSGSNFMIFMLGALLKKQTKMVMLITRERIEISQKFQQIWIQQAQAIFPV